MQTPLSWLQEIQSYLETVEYDVQARDQELLICLQHPDQPGQTLSMRLSFLSSEDNFYFARFEIPLGLEIPDQYWLKAAQVIADFNRTSPLGEFSISECSQPYYDYLVQVPAHGDFALNLLAAIQMSFLCAGRFMEAMQQKLRDWLLPAKRSNLQVGAA